MNGPRSFLSIGLGVICYLIAGAFGSLPYNIREEQGSDSNGLPNSNNEKNNLEEGIETLSPKVNDLMNSVGSMYSNEYRQSPFSIFTHNWPYFRLNRPKKHDYLVRAVKRGSERLSPRADHDFLVRTI
ncbi:unnamed protein product [Lepeophtheirus salmonis]|uniref:(salmon louse) hypothetical protein n=1 Tax=Lepeophtheirus salmonis TaxID=72036 RepID=A0A7R8HDH3_LEPSM|nr:unnamed protein product [Lepeophtheirus salmonis]CAF3029687.1 unnamed protein product [Lepeophtheirus salmonis]